MGAVLLDLVAEEGLDAVSVRTVAAAAGCSAGAVQKYFATRDEMLSFALDLADQRTLHRLDRVNVQGKAPDMVRQWLLAILPLDDERRADARIWLEFATRAISHPPFAMVHAATDRDVRAALTGYLEQARATGAMPAGLDCAAAAHALVAVTNGLTIQLLYDPAAEVLDALDVALSALLRPAGQ